MKTISLLITWSGGKQATFVEIGFPILYLIIHLKLLYTYTLLHFTGKYLYLLKLEVFFAVKCF